MYNLMSIRLCIRLHMLTRSAAVHCHVVSDIMVARHSDFPPFCVWRAEREGLMYCRGACVSCELCVSIL